MCGIASVFRRWSICLGVFLGLLAIAGPAVAQDFGLVTTLVHPNERASNEDRFGSGVAISGGTLFVGAKSERAANDYSGVVHVFSDADWSEVAQLKSSLDADIEFGAAIELDGDRAIISNMAIDGGVVWFFEKAAGVWTERLRVKGLVNEAFGYRLALRGDFAFIAAPRLGTGNVRVYRRDAGTWGEIQVLTGDDALDEDFFGYSLAFDGQRLAVGAPGNFLGPKRSGVYTFSKVGTSFVQDGKLAADDPALHWFGAEVGVSGDTLLVNASPAYQSALGGKALVYERRAEQWELDGELTVDGEASFPTGLAMDGDTAWFGARTDEPRSVSVYAFNRANGGWLQAQKLSFPDLGQSAITTWAFQDGTFAIGFWSGLRSESVQVYRQANHGSSGGGGLPNGTAGTEAIGGSSAAGSTNVGGGSGEGTAAGVGANTSTSGGAAGKAASSERGGCSCTLIRGSARAWPLAVLAVAMALTRRGRRRRRTGFVPPRERFRWQSALGRLKGTPD